MNRTPDPWQAWRRHTAARIALGRSGNALPTAEVLRFGAAHALARDAVHHPLDLPALQAGLGAAAWSWHAVHSAAPDRATFLMRPDLGRRLDAASHEALAAQGAPECDLLPVLADGLSAWAVERHALPLLAALRSELAAGWRFGPVVVARQARVALGDEIGALLQARLVLVLIGERPGLSAPDSLGAYLTWSPRPGRSDAERNCVSNIRPEGLAPERAAERLAWLCREAAARALTGVALKDLSDTPRLA